MTKIPAEPPLSPALEQPLVKLIFGAVLLVMLLASLDSTIVSTALPTIVGEFGGLQHLSWIVTAYMLAQTVVTPIYGKMGDLFGRKIVLQSAILLFLLGSVLCGLSRSMGELIAFRALQGLGGGGLMVLPMAAVADIIPARDRGRFQGYIGAVYGLSTVLGPLIGGFFVQHLNWRWIFYINLPLGAVAMVIIAAAFTSPAKRQERPAIDVAGALLMAIMLIALVLFTSLGGNSFAWSSPIILSLIALTVVALAAFVVIEQRAAEPILPLRLFSNPTFVVGCTMGFIVGLALFGSITYLPVYLQVVRGVSPSSAGLQITPMMAGVLISSIAGGQFISRVGRYRILPIIGTAVMTIGLGLLSTLGLTSSMWAAPSYALLLGLGIGMVMQVLVIAVQNAVEYRDLGAATSGATLFRSTGGSVGVSLFGALFAANLAHGLAQKMPAGVGLPTATDPTAIAALPAAIHQIYIEVFTEALQPVFLVATVIAASAFALSWLLKEAVLNEAPRSESVGESFAIPHDATSLAELETMVLRLGEREARWETYQKIALRAGVTLAPDEMWLLAQICLTPAPVGVSANEIAVRFSKPASLIEGLAERLVGQRLLLRQLDGALFAPEEGRRIYERIVAGYNERAMAFLERWSPKEHAEVRAMLARLARDLVADLPVEPQRR